jgi:hypothetical protein
MAELTLHYWRIPGRSSLAYLLLKASGVPVEYLDEDELETKVRLSAISRSRLRTLHRLCRLCGVVLR